MWNNKSGRISIVFAAILNILFVAFLIAIRLSITQGRWMIIFFNMIILGVFSGKNIDKRKAKYKKLALVMLILIAIIIFSFNQTTPFIFSVGVGLFSLYIMLSVLL